MVRAGKALAAHGPQALRQAQWTVADVGGAAAPADLVLVSYVIGELEPGERSPASPATPGRSPTTRSRSSSRERPRATSACSRSAPQ